MINEVYHMTDIEPVICKKFRRIFKNTECKTFLMNDFKTSKLCNYCNNILEHFLERERKKSKNKDKIEMCYGLSRCQSVTPQFKIIHTRVS